MPKGINSKLFASDHEGGRRVQIAAVRSAMGSKTLLGSHEQKQSAGQMQGNVNSSPGAGGVSPGKGASRQSGKGGAKAGGTKHC